MLVKHGAFIGIAEFATASKRELPWFVRNDASAMKRLAAIEPVMLNPEKFLYMRTRMVSAVEAHGPNANGDAFEDAELAARYATFIQSAVNIDHDNDDPKKAVGFILDARYIPEAKYVEGIHAIDRTLAEAKRPGIIRAIEGGVVTDTSMGCYVEKSLCSECLKEAGWDGKDFSQLNKYAALLSVGRGIATVPEEYCHHIGKYGEKKGGANGPYEINRGVTFFEDSIITTAGADKDAKYLEKLAQLGIDWTRFIIDRSKGGSEMNGVKVAADGLKLDTMKEPGDNPGTPADKDKALHDQAKGKSESTDAKGNAVQTVDEKGDYVLANKRNLEAIAIVRKMAKDNPEAVKDLVFDDKADVGGVPPAVKAGEEDRDSAKEDAATERKPEGVVEDKDKGLIDKVVAAVKSLLPKQAIDGTGNPTETATEKTEQMPPKSGDPDKALAGQAKGTSEKTGMNGNPVQTAEDPKDHPLTASRRASDESARLDMMVSEMQKGRSFDDAEKAAKEKLGMDARIARRRAIAEDLNKGSMGSPEVPDNVKAEQEESKDAKCGRVAMDKPNESPEQRQDEGTTETKTTAPIRTDAGKKTAQGTPGAPASDASTAPPELPPVTSKDGPDKVVKNLDQKADAMEAIGRAKRIRASVLAKAGYSAAAKRNLMDIARIEASIGNFERIANNIENVMESLKTKVAGASRGALVAHVRSLVAQAMKAMAEEDKAMEDMEKMDKADDEKVEASRKSAAMEAELRRMKAERQEDRNRLVALLKSKAIKEVIDLGRQKGLVTTANLQAKLSELSGMNDAEFEATRKVWASLPNASRPGFVSRSVREAARVAGTGMSTVEPSSGSTPTGDINAGTLFS